MSHNATVQEVTVEVPSLEDIAKASLTPKQHDRFVAALDAGVVPPMLFAAILGVKPQQVYGYMRKGVIKSSTTTDTDKKVIAVDDAREYCNKYFTKKAERQAKIDSELEAE